MNGYKLKLKSGKIVHFITATYEMDTVYLYIKLWIYDKDRQCYVLKETLAYDRQEVEVFEDDDC